MEVLEEALSLTILLLIFCVWFDLLMTVDLKQCAKLFSCVCWQLFPTPPCFFLHFHICINNISSYSVIRKIVNSIIQIFQIIEVKNLSVIYSTISTLSDCSFQKFIFSLCKDCCILEVILTNFSVWDKDKRKK